MESINGKLTVHKDGWGENGENGSGEETVSGLGHHNYGCFLNKYISARYMFILLLFLGHINIYGMRVNLSISLVAMVKSNGSDEQLHYSYCYNYTNSSQTSSAGTFEWNQYEQGLILSAFYYGYVFTQLPGAWLSKYFGGKWVLGLSVFSSAILNLIIPYAAYHGYMAVVGVRALLGVVQGVYFPACYTLMGFWIPQNERSTSFSIVAAGLGIGSTTYLYVAGRLSSSNIMEGWPSVFYISGIVGVGWCILWFTLGYSSPSSHPWISRKEKEYIMSSLGHTSEINFSHIPVWAMLTSIPMWAIIIVQCCSEFGYFLFLAETPMYLSTIQGFDLNNSGFLSSVPWIVQIFLGISAGILADFMIRRRMFRVGTIRKGFTIVALMGQAILLVMTSYSGCNTTFVVVYLLTAISIGGFITAGYSINKLDIAPSLAGVISGFGNTLTTVGGIVGPLMVAALTDEQPTVQQWKNIFWVVCGVYAFGTSIFVIFGTGELQDWDKNLNKGNGPKVTIVNESDIQPLLDDDDDASDTDQRNI